MEKSNRAIFFDKDGTLLVDDPYNVDPRRMRWAPGARGAVSRLFRAGWRLVVVSNQAGVARGRFPERALLGVRRRLGQMFASAGAGLEGFYYCPHDPAGSVTAYSVRCRCRKPGDGLIRGACRDLRVNASACWLVGDILDDIEAGRRAGCRTLLLDNGNETIWRLSKMRTPHASVQGLEEAAALILEGQR